MALAETENYTLVLECPALDTSWHYIPQQTSGRHQWQALSLFQGSCHPGPAENLPQEVVLPRACLPPPGTGKCHWGPRLGLYVVYVYGKETGVLLGLLRFQLFMFCEIGSQVSQNGLELAQGTLKSGSSCPHLSNADLAGIHYHSLYVKSYLLLLRQDPNQS